MKLKFFKIIMYLLIIMAGVTLGRSFYKYILPTAAGDFLSKIGTIEELELKENLSQYEEQIKEEMDSSTYRNNLKNSYFALGYAESLKGDYEKSNEYYYRALGINQNKNSLFRGTIYREFAYNALLQGNTEQSFNDFKLAYEIFEKSSSQEEMAMLYYRYSQALNEVGRHENQITFMLESIKNQKQDPYQQIQNLRLLAKIYLNAGYYSVGTQYLLNAFELSVRNNYEELEREVTIEIGNAYYLDLKYERALETLYPCLMTWEDEDLTTYLPNLVKSLKSLYGSEEATKFLNKHVENIKNYTDGNVVKSQFWVELLLAKISVLDQNIDDALFYLERANAISENYDTVITTDYLLVLKKTYLDIQSLSEVESTQLVEEYKQLYNKIVDSDLYFMYKIGLLDDIVGQGLYLKDFTLGYHSLKNRLAIFSNSSIERESLDFEKIDQEVKTELENEKITRIISFILIGIIIVSATGIISYLVFIYKEHLLNLQTEVTERIELDTITETLIGNALYNKLEKYMDQSQPLMFIVVQFDDLKRYNKVYGYLNGDQIIKKLATEIKDIFNQEYISRHCGRFFVIVSTQPKEICLFKVQKLLKQIYDLNISNTSDLEHGRMTVSAGLAQGVIHSYEDIDQLISSASHNLDVSRQRGGNSFTV